MVGRLYENIIANMGYRNSPEFIIKYILPLMTVIVVFFIVSIIVLPSLPIYVPFILLGLGTVFVLAYPYMLYEKKRISIEENLHLFITFAGTISTTDINRNVLFKKVAEKQNLGEVANMMEKILYFATKWGLGFSRTCRIMGRLSPSKTFGDFLDRLAIMLDYGEDMDIFLLDEQEAIMEDYATNYKKSLENIKLVQDVFVALTMALGFMLAVALMLPLVSGTSIEIVVRYALLAMIVLDLGILFFVKNFIPSDKLCFEGLLVDDETKKLYNWVYVLVPASAILTILLFYINQFSFLTNISLGVIPFFIIGLRAQMVENLIYTREKAYPSFIRAFGTAVEVKSGAMNAAIMSLRVHDFGPLNEPLFDLYKRRKTGNDKYKSWEYFNAATGSNLIHQFTGIFYESVFLGGNPLKIGEIVSRNFNKILSLRKLRQQLASGLRGSLYGALAGFSAAAYVSAKITDMLGSIFTDPFSSGDVGGLGNIVSSVATLSLDVDMSTIVVYIAIMIIIHAVISALVIKIVDGGNLYSAFFDICIMIWLGVLVSWIVPFAIDTLLPGFSTLTSVPTVP